MSHFGIKKKVEKMRLFLFFLFYSHLQRIFLKLALFFFFFLESDRKFQIHFRL